MGTWNFRCFRRSIVRVHSLLIYFILIAQNLVIKLDKMQDITWQCNHHIGGLWFQPKFYKQLQQKAEGFEWRELPGPRDYMPVACSAIGMEPEIIGESRLKTLTGIRFVRRCGCGMCLRNRINVGMITREVM